MRAAGSGGRIPALLPACLVLLLPSITRADVQVTVVKLDGSEVTAHWAPLQRPGHVALRTTAGEEIFAIDELLAVRPQRGSAPDRGRRWPVTVWVAGGSIVPAEILAAESRRLRLRTPLVDDWDLTLEQLDAVRWNEHRGFSPPFASYLSERGPDDLLLAIREQRINVFAGSLEGLDTGGGSFRFAERSARFTSDKAWGVVLAARAEDKPAKVVCIMDDEHHLAGDVEAATDQALMLRVASGKVVAVPLDVLREMRVASGRVLLLSTLKPAAVEQRSFFDVPWPVRVDRSVSNGPLALRGQVFTAGFGVHADCSLTFDLPPGYDRLAATVGIDDAVRGQGQVRFIILGPDGRELLRTALLGGEDAPLQVSADIAALPRITLRAEAAGPLDIGGHADWADVRLIK